MESSEAAILKRISFKAQFYISLAIAASAFILGHILQNGIVLNIGYAFCGLLFVGNPVWPKMWDWRDHDTLKRAMRIAGVVVIIVFGFLISYGV